jgi:hypothetical protein
MPARTAEIEPLLPITLYPEGKVDLTPLLISFLPEHDATLLSAVVRSLAWMQRKPGSHER